MRHDTPFASRFKALREAIGATQKEMSDRIGVSQQTISFYEQGQRLPGFHELNQICAETGCSIKYLFGYQDNMSDDIEGLSVSSNSFFSWGGVNERTIIALMRLIGKEAAAMDVLMVNSQSFKDLLGYLGVLAGGELERNFENPAFTSGYYDFLCHAALEKVILDVKKYGKNTLSDSELQDIELRKQALEIESERIRLVERNENEKSDQEEEAYANDILKKLVEKANGDKFEEFRYSLLFPEYCIDSEQGGE